jgi:hypothetical protein
MTHAHHQENPFAGQGPVLLDIGGDVGALVISMPARLEGREVEVVRLGEDLAVPTHVGVVARPTASGSRPTAVFPELEAGRYALRLLPDGRPELTVDVVGGLVVEQDWPV